MSINLRKIAKTLRLDYLKLKYIDILNKIDGKPDITSFTITESVTDQQDYIIKQSSISNTRLGKLFSDHEGRLCFKWHHYFFAYEDIMENFKEGFISTDGDKRPLRLLEIGVSHGGSLELWRKYFGPNAIIHGIDIDPRCASLNTNDLPVHIGSQTDDNFLKEVVKEMGGIDIVIDDGSHIAKHQAKSFKILFPLLPYGGKYIIEDTHTSYWKDFGGGYKRRGTAIEMAKAMIDDMHLWYFRKRFSRNDSYAKNNISSITFYDSIIVFEKRKIDRPVQERRGTSSF